MIRHKTIYRRAHLVVFLLICSATAFVAHPPRAAAAGEEEEERGESFLAAPEEEMTAIGKELTRLHRQVASVGKLRSVSRQKLNERQAQIILASAHRNFAEKRFPLAILTYERYLREDHLPPSRDYVTIQLRLSAAYEALGNGPQALQACRNFLSAFISSEEKDYDTLREVIKRLLRLPVYHLAAHRSSLRKLFTGLMSLSIPEPQRYEIVYYTARAAANAGLTTLADQWLANTFAFSGLTPLKSRALYFQGLIAASTGQWEQAEGFLHKAVSFEERQAGELLPYAYLSLARVLSYRGKPKLALTTYQKLKEDSLQYKEALYEQAFLALQMGSYKKARLFAASFLSRFPKDDPLAKELQPLMPYFTLRAGDYSVAARDLATAATALTAIQAKLAQNFRPLEDVTFPLLMELATTVAPLSPPSPLLVTGLSLYEQGFEHRQTLNEATGRMQSFLEILSRLDLPTAFPRLYYRSKQTVQLGVQALGVGHRLLAVHRALYEDQLTLADRTRLEELGKQRRGLLSVRETFYQDALPGRAYGHFLRVGASLAEEQRRLSKIQAQLASYQYLAGRVALSFAASYKRRLQATAAKALDIQEHHTALLGQMRLTRLHYGLEAFAKAGEKTFLSRYAALLEDELGVLTPYLQRPRQALDQVAAHELMELRRQWEALMLGVYEGLGGVANSLGKRVQALAGKLDDLQQRREGLRQRLALATTATNSALTESLHPLLSHYEGVVGERLARNKKWQADLKWIEYQQAHDGREQLEGQFRADRELLDSHLDQLQHGVLWSWPQ